MCSEWMNSAPTNWHNRRVCGSDMQYNRLIRLVCQAAQWSSSMSLMIIENLF
jgi:hypothetical protein